MTTNLTAVLHKVNDIRLEERPIPEIKDDEVLVRMAWVGICGSDVHYWTKGRIGPFVLEAPMVMGHEASGLVDRVGAAVTSLVPGDRVAIEPGVPCRVCHRCKTGKYNLCGQMQFCATPPHHGNLARYFAHPADFCHKLGSEVSLEEGALLEPLSVGVHACRRAGVGLGSVVLVLGSGPIGLVTTLAAKAMAASTVIVTDVVGHRLELARKCGADLTLLVEGGEDPGTTAARVRALVGAEPDLAIDCVGVEASARLAIQVTKAGGRVVVVGMGAEEVTVPLVQASIKEVDLIGSFRYCNDYPLAVEMVSQGRADVKQLITHRYSLEETQTAFETALSGQGNPVKILIQC